MSLQLNTLAKSIDALEPSVEIASSLDTSDDALWETVRAGVIQNFKAAYERCWKMMKRGLEENIGNTYVDDVTRRELFRLAAESRLITGVERWMDYHMDRNQTSQAYDAETAQSMFEEATQFSGDARQLLGTLDTHND